MVLVQPTGTAVLFKIERRQIGVFQKEIYQIESLRLVISLLEARLMDERKQKIAKMGDSSNKFWLPILDDFRMACHGYDKKKELSAFVQEYLS